MDRRLYFADPALAEVETDVVETGESGGRPWVRLAETVFHPEGGGQPADHGTIGGVGVVDVKERGDAVLHFLAGPPPAGRVVARIDAARRFDFRQQHTAQHLLTAILNERHGRPTTSFHLGDAYTAIEITGAVPTASELRGYEEEVNRAIREDRAVRTRWVGAEDLERLAVRTRGLPEDHRGPVRLVEIEGIDLNTCGGTHVTHLSEIQVVHLLDAAPARGGARIRFLAGGRVLSRLVELGRREDELKARLANAPEEFARVLDGWIADKKSAEKRIKVLEADLADRVAAEISADPGPVLSRRLPASGVEHLRAIASRVLARRPEAVVSLVGEDAGAAPTCFLVCSGPQGPPDVTDLGARLRDELGGKGGGRGRMFQGTVNPG